MLPVETQYVKIIGTLVIFFWLPVFSASVNHTKTKQIKFNGTAEKGKKNVISDLFILSFHCIEIND